MRARLTGHDRKEPAAAAVPLWIGTALILLFLTVPQGGSQRRIPPETDPFGSFGEIHFPPERTQDTGYPES